jgi:TPR repeat protein
MKKLAALVLVVLGCPGVVLAAGQNPDFAAVQRNAERGDAKAQLLLGLMYAGGDGTQKNEVMAIQWFTKAAEQGVAAGGVPA